ncbi:MAG: hypothetical protein ACJAXX_001933 [Roseivirga sp.]|jgi:hypothetical protein
MKKAILILLSIVAVIMAGYFLGYYDFTNAMIVLFSVILASILSDFLVKKLIKKYPTYFSKKKS